MNALLQLPSAAGYAGLAALVGGESAGLPIPGETSLLTAAVLASHGRLSLPLVIATAAAAAVAGDNVGYVIGRRGGRWLLARPGRWEGRRRRLLARGDELVARHGAKAVLLGRWAPGLRMTTAWLAGAARMPWPRFLLWNGLGGAAWATTVGLAGYSLGRAASAVFGALGVALLAAILTGALLLRWHRRCGPTSSTSS